MDFSILPIILGLSLSVLKLIAEMVAGKWSCTMNREFIKEFSLLLLLSGVLITFCILITIVFTPDQMPVIKEFLKTGLSFIVGNFLLKNPTIRKKITQKVRKIKRDKRVKAEINQLTEGDRKSDWLCYNKPNNL